MYQETLKQKHKMKTTKERLTPETVLIIINEIKSSIDGGNFLPKNHRPKTPSIYNILRVLLDKGVVSKKRGIYLWTGGQPNIYMATEVLKIHKIYVKESTEQRFIRQENIQKFLDDLKNQNVMESLDVQEIEYPKEHPIQKGENIFKEIPMTIQERMTDYFSISKELELKNSQLEEQILAIKKELEDYKFEISELLKVNENLKHQIYQLVGVKSKPFDEIFEADIEEEKGLVEEKPAPKKVKLFGITILKIE